MDNDPLLNEYPYLYSIGGIRVPHYVVSYAGEELQFCTWMSAIIWSRYIQRTGVHVEMPPRAIIRWN